MNNSRRLKILHVYMSPSFSGAEAYAMKLAAAQAEAHDVAFLVKPQSPLEKQIRENHAGLRICHSWDDGGLSQTDIVVLHSTQELRSHWPRLLAEKLKAKLTGRRAPKVIVYSHIWISHSKKDPLHAIVYSAVDEFWCSSDSSRRNLEQLLPVSKDRIVVVRYGRDLARRDRQLATREDALRRFDIPPSATVIGTMARVDKGKGSIELFEAVTDLMQSHPEVHFLMIGPPTSSDPKAIALDKELNDTIGKLNPAIRSRMHKLGNIEDGARYLKAFDLFVLATYKENFALTLIEAFAASVPCLATDSGGSPDLVRPHSTGWLFLPESTSSLRAALLQALDERAQWNVFGKNGRALVELEHNFTDVLKHVDSRLSALANRQ